MAFVLTEAQYLTVQATAKHAYPTAPYERWFELVFLPDFYEDALLQPGEEVAIANVS